MREETLLYWGMVVTVFLLISAMITARELFERYIEKRSAEDDEKPAGTPAAIDKPRK